MGHAAVRIEIDKTKLLATLLARKPEVLRLPQRGKPEILDVTADFQVLRRGAEVYVIAPDDEIHISSEIAHHHW